MTDTQTTIPAYVYMLWFHQEGGPEDMVATLNRNRVMYIFRTGYPEYIERYLKEEKKDLVKRLSEILSHDDEWIIEEYNGIFDITDVWGGLHFQVVKLK